MKERMDMKVDQGREPGHIQHIAFYKLLNELYEGKQVNTTRCLASKNSTVTFSL